MPVCSIYGGYELVNRNKIIMAAAALLLLTGVAWYFGSPAYAMIQLRDAAVEGNKEDLEKRIDFPKVRESLKSELRAKMAAEMAKPENQDAGFGTLGAMVGMAMIDSMIEGFVTPDAIAAMIKQGNMRRAGQQPLEQPEAANVEPAEWSIERDGFSRFTATPEVPSGEKAPTMVFERDGLGWKLAGIELPEGGLATNSN